MSRNRDHALVEKTVLVKSQVLQSGGSNHRND